MTNRYATDDHVKTDRFSGSCDKCVYPVVREFPVGDSPFGDFTWDKCPGCGAQVRLERLYATWSDENCDPRCQMAIGNICVCGCGGANHQSGYIPPKQTGVLPAHVVEKYRERVATRKAAQEKAAATRRVKSDAKKREHKRAQDTATIAFVEDLPDEVRAVMVTDEEHDETRGVSDLLCFMRGHDIITDMRSRLWQYGSLSEKQVQFAARLIEQERQHRARKEADAEINWIPTPEGRTEIEGVVLSVKEKFTDFGLTLKFLVRVGDDSGAYKVWSTVPSAILRRNIGDGVTREIDRGDRVRFTAKLTQSDDDKSFAWASRPSKAEYVKGA